MNVYHFKDLKRVYITVIDKITGEPVEIPVSLVTNMVVIHAYGTTTNFETSNRAKGTYLDSRDGKRHPLRRAKAELMRMVGATHGCTAFKQFTTI